MTIMMSSRIWIQNSEESGIRIPPAKRFGSTTLVNTLAWNTLAARRKKEKIVSESCRNM
jgi:hypothetical protein